MDKVLNGILLVVFLFVGTVFVSFVFSNERPRRDREYYEKVDDKDSSTE